ncbi:MAG TPA: EAL domain-containing protein [Granulicella sp.]|jgi:diguanylate cyclase (GGDEF)-like protein/PAS domain S-box-containing protein|nr:EAL domain-containing protein [Granulicella sp.]
MNFDGLLTTIVLAALVLIFGSILRRSANIRLHLWFIAWTLILIHFVVVWLGIPGLGPTANEIVGVDMLVCAGTAFLCALCPVTLKRHLLLLSIALSLPGCAYCTLVLAGATSPWLLSSLVLVGCFGVIGMQIVAAKRDAYFVYTLVAYPVCGGIIIISAFRSHPAVGVVTVLAAFYISNAPLFYNHFRRLSAGVCTSILGFVAWGAVWPVGAWLDVHYPNFAPPPVLWNLPKFFVAVGMILTLLEDEAKSAAYEALRNRELYDRSQCGLFRSSWEGLLLDCNESMAKMSGYGSRVEMLGRSVFDLYANTEDHDSWTTKLLTSGIVENVELQFTRATGEKGTALLNAKLQRDGRGEPVEIEGALLDVTEHRQLHRQLEWQARHDPLTGLPNRTVVDQSLRQAILRADRRGTQVALICIDLDRFKFINDHYGHGTGDEFLRQLAARLSKRIRATDMFGRFGGDEFVVVLDSLHAESDASRLASDLIQSLGTPLPVKNQLLSASISVGIAVYPEDAKTLANLHSRADHALYHAKELGRNQYQCYSQCRGTSDDDTELERYLECGLQEDRFILYYQPQVRVDQVPCGVEALLRFRHPTRGLLLPDDFLPIAEKNGLLHRVGEWVIQEACRQAHLWRSQGLPLLTMSVNVSAVQFASADFAEAVARILQVEAMPPQLLEIELTESLLISGLEESVRQMDRLKQLGIRIAVDDFGTGYSSLSYLHRLPIDVIKIDRLFVEKISEPQGTYPIVTAILSLADALKIETIAEGIETEAQLSLLAELGASRFQGYLFSRPLAAADIPAYLRRTGVAQPSVSDSATAN